MLFHLDSFFCIGRETLFIPQAPSTRTCARVGSTPARTCLSVRDLNPRGIEEVMRGPPFLWKHSMPLRLWHAIIRLGLSPDCTVCVEFP